MEKEKRKKIVFAIIILFAILCALLLMIFLKYIRTCEDNNMIDKINVDNWNIKPSKNSYDILIDMSHQEGKTYKKYNIYMLDENNNLIYEMDEISIDFNKNKTATLTYNIMYDISSIKSIKISNNIKYKKDLRSNTKYIGITTSKKTTTSSNKENNYSVSGNNEIILLN